MVAIVSGNGLGLLNGSAASLGQHGVARITPIVFLPNYPSHDFGKMGRIFPHWRHRIFAAQPRLDRTRDRIAVVA